jgi:hypothetical protein
MAMTKIHEWTTMAPAAALLVMPIACGPSVLHERIDSRPQRPNSKSKPP